MFMESAAKRELQRILKSEALEEVHHATPWCSKAFYVQKPGSPDEDPSVGLVTNLRSIRLSQELDTLWMDQVIS